jgi:hypothetical protein
MGCMHLATCRACAQKSGYTSYNSVYVSICDRISVFPRLFDVINHYKKGKRTEDFAETHAVKQRA